MGRWVFEGKKVVLLCDGGDKRSQTADIERAMERWTEWQQRVRIPVNVTAGGVARASLVAYLRGVSRADLDFEFRLTDHIDWSHNPKRVPFICRV